MNEIQQKRIEEAAENHEQCYNVGEEHGYLYTHKGDIKEAVIYGATFALQNQWISVEEGLPEVNKLVFGCVNDEGIPQAVGMAYYDEYGGWHYSDEEETSLITHWMPIPSLEGGKE
ncbi:MAG: DUF551 domain-containing protein [Bacteroidales bacterium]|nr:DUF551 domain-containing protein [Bacteroidales bacterium]